MYKRMIYFLIMLLVIAVATGGCKKNDKDSKGKIELTYVEWVSEVASTNVVKAVIEERLGYECKITPVSAAAMWQAIASGDVDGMVAAWLPATHGDFLEKFKNKVEVVRKNMKGGRIGLVVPDYVPLKNISDLNMNADKFEGKIYAIDSGSGTNRMCENALKDYNLNFKMIEGSDATMVGALKDAVRNNRWIVVTGWVPHWKFSRWKLKFLNDPKKSFGDEEYIATVVRKGFASDYPDIYKFFKKFNWKPEDMQEVMLWNAEDGADPYTNALRWIKENSKRVDGWVK